MGGKKKKGKKKAKKEKKEGDDDKEEVNEEFLIKLPSYQWIRVHLKLCDPMPAPADQYNSFRTIMRSNQSMMDVKKRIIDYHGRIENISLYNTDPYPARNKANDMKKEKKPRVPPHSALKKLLELKKEKEAIEEKEENDKKKAEAAGQSHMPIPDEPEERDIYSEDLPDPKRFDVLNMFDFPEDLKGDPIVGYDSDKLTLFDIFEDYGTEFKPKVQTLEQDKKDFDAEQAKKPKKEKVEKPVPVPVVKEEENKEEEEKEGEAEPDSPSKLPFEEEEPEEVFQPACEKTLYYDFDPFDGKDPVLLALMHRGLDDKFTI